MVSPLPITYDILNTEYFVKFSLKLHSPGIYHQLHYCMFSTGTRQRVLFVCLFTNSLSSYSTVWQCFLPWLQAMHNIPYTESKNSFCMAEVKGSLLESRNYYQSQKDVLARVPQPSVVVNRQESQRLTESLGL